MYIHGKISQIKPSCNKMSFINIQDAGMGGIQFWFNVRFCPTYLLRESDNCHIVQFDNQDWADEWMELHKENYKEIRKLDTRPNNVL